MGTEFIDLFNEWSDSYDRTVQGKDREYREVFHDYDRILNEVSRRVKGTVLEFGPGTGNLTLKLLESGCQVKAIEPSVKMIEKAKEKISDFEIYQGDFLHFPEVNSVNGIVSTYAFHHLTDQEKEKALRRYGNILPSGGKLVFADTAFVSDDHKTYMIQRAEENQYHNLVRDLKTEYYTTLPVLEKLFRNCGFHIFFQQLNKYVWLMDATKK